MSSTKSYSGIRYYWLILLALLFIAASFTEDIRLWGIDHLKFLDTSAKLIFVLLTVLCFIPPVYKKVNGFLIAAQNSYLILKKPSRIIHSAVLFIITAAVLYLFRSEVHLLGDGYLRGDELEYGFGYLPLSTEPLTAILHFGFYKLLSIFSEIGTYQSIQIFSCLLGGIFVLIVLNIARPNPDLKISPLLLIAGIGGTQFFFGYVESYGLLYIGLFLFIWLSYRYITEGKSYAAACVVYLITFLSHFSLIFTLPAFLYFLLSGLRNKRMTGSGKAGGIVAILIMAIGFVYFHYVYVPAFGKIAVGFLLPFTPGDYWLFDPGHITDILNSLLLSGTFFILAIPLFIQRNVLQKYLFSEKIFSSLLTLGALGYLFFIDPKLGFARDWDLFAPAGMVLVLVSYFLFIRNSNFFKNHGSYLSIAVLLPLIFTASFITVNSGLESSRTRFEHILGFYNERSASGFEALGGQVKRFYRNQEDLRQAIRHYKKAYELLKNPRYMTDIASVYDVFYNNYTDDNVRRKFIDSIEYYSKQALITGDSSFKAYEFLTNAALYRNDIRLAIHYSDSVLKFISEKNEPEFRDRRAGLFLKIEDFNGAEKEYLRILDIDPDFNMAYARLGTIYIQKGDKEQAVRCLTEYLRREPDSELKSQIESTLRKLR